MDFKRGLDRMGFRHRFKKTMADLNSSKWTVYILKCSDGSFYTGITNDLNRRLEKHRVGQGAKYTKGRGPFKLVYRETCSSRKKASKREIEIKSLKREQKIDIIRAKHDFFYD